MGGLHVLAFLRRLRNLLPEESAPPVEYHVPLVAFVAAVVAGAAALCAITFRPVSDPETLVVGGLVLAIASYSSVRMTAGVETVWTAGVFVHLALTLTFGAPGALTAAIAQAGGTALRHRSGYLRTSFNAADFLIADIGAWLVFTAATSLGSGVVWGALSATAAGVTACIVNFGLLTAVLRLASDGRLNAWTSFRRSVTSTILYNVGYGWAAYGAVLLHGVAGTIGFTTTLLPILLLQGFLVLLARRIKAQEAERAEHAKERESLLQQAIDASDAERKRIASDLHDGVVQTLAGLAFTLAARGSTKDRDPQLLEAADTLRASVTDLRTLMIEIAPPDLDEGGVDSALRKLLEPLPARGIEVELEATAGTHLPPDKTSLVFRVAQEAIRNVVNHSQATRVITKFRYADGMVTLEVEDNGRGFSAADRTRRRSEGHVGLHLLNNAVEASSGRLSLDSEPGRGTSLMLQLPC